MALGSTRAGRRGALIGSVAVLLLALGAPGAQSVPLPPAATSTPSPSATPEATASPSPTVDATPGATADATDPTTDAAESPTPTPTVTTSPTVTPDFVPGSSASVDLADADGLTTKVARFIPYTATATAIGGKGLATVTLPLPPGLVPVVLNGTLTSLADSPGVVRIRVGGSFVEMDAERGGPFTLPIPFSAVDEDSVTIEVRNTLEPGQGECDSDFTTSETIEDLVLGFIGTETPPTTIAGFFSPPVQKVTLVSPDTPTLKTAEATMSAAGAIATRYDRTVPVVSVTEGEAAADATLLDDTDGPNRVVRLLPNDSDTVEVAVTNPGTPTLTISGPASELTEAAASLASPSLGLAGAPVATDLSEKRVSAVTTSLSLAELGATTPRLAGLGRLEFALPIAQDRFGGPVNAITIHLEGAHTPVAETAQATASILWNDQLVASQLLGSEFAYTADVTVDGPLIRRDNFLVIRLDATPPGGNCSRATQSMQLDINGYASTLTATPGQSLGEGFGRFPQAFGNSLRVAFGSRPLDSDLVDAACSLVVSLQRAASQQLEVTAQDFASFVAAPYPGLIVGATPADADAVAAPLRFEPWRAVNAAATEFTVIVDGPFAALEAFEYDGRNLLMLGSTEPLAVSTSLVLQLADEAENGEFGWFGLRDNLFVAQPQYDSIFLDSTTVVPQASTQNDGRQLPPWWVLLIVAVAIILLLRWWFVRRRAKRIQSRLAAADAEAAAPSEAASAAASDAPEQ